MEKLVVVFLVPLTLIVASAVVFLRTPYTASEPVTLARSFMDLLAQEQFQPAFELIQKNRISSECVWGDPPVSNRWTRFGNPPSPG